jgi:acyl-CoA reductase-like NAD-dependent aldehyde dehydrogenase
VLVHYAGWTDKLHAVLGGVNPVAAPFLSFSSPEATGVVGVVAPEEPELLGLVGAIAPAMAAGNAVVAICSERWPLAGLDLGEVLAVSDVPGGVVNLLAGRREELAPALGAHRDLNAIVDASGDAELGERLDVLAAETVKRVVRSPAGSDAVDDSLRRLEALTELKTAWHPVGV